MNIDNSEIVHHKGGGITISGADAINYFRAVTLYQGLKLYAKSKVLLTRTATPTVMLKIASEYTGKQYKRGEYMKAAEDVKIWCDTMKAALPITNNE